MTMKMILVAGARPNFMKIAPLVRAIESHNSLAASPGTSIEYFLVHTGQHYDHNMSDSFFDDLSCLSPISTWVWAQAHMRSRPAK